MLLYINNYFDELIDKLYLIIIEIRLMKILNKSFKNIIDNI